MDSEEILHLTRKKAGERGLTARLKLAGNNSNHPAKYLACISHPQGKTALMEVYRIIEEIGDTYILASVTDREFARLERKCCNSAGMSFCFNERASQRTDS